jgi:hypothetical protein
VETGSAYPCPACGFEVFSEPSGSYDICRICGWEDDEVQLRFPAMRGGANKASLFECQQLFLQQIPLELLSYGGYIRCPDWRPLTEEEYGETSGTPTDGLAYFPAVGTVEPVYYWRKSAEREGDR